MDKCCTAGRLQDTGLTSTMTLQHAGSVQILAGQKKKPKPWQESPSSPRFSNPNFVSDRFKKVIQKPQMPEWWKNRHRLPFNSAWMDYCDPYHCNDYHKTACGLNRNAMKFKYFQSACHIILNNMCATYRGFMLFDVVDIKNCTGRVMFLRSQCTPCEDDTHAPVCAMSASDFHVVLFKNSCAMETANCEPETLDEYNRVDMGMCALMKIRQIDPGFDNEPPHKEIYGDEEAT